MLLLFLSTRDVIKAEKIIRAEGIPCKIIPVPKHISSECGMGINIDEAETSAVELLLTDFIIRRYSE